MIPILAELISQPVSLTAVAGMAGHVITAT